MNISRVLKGTSAAVLAPLALVGVVAPAVASAATSGDHAAAAVTGDGSNNNPYTAPCADPGSADCTVTAFAGRTLRGASSESVPAYRCPADHPYLRRENFAPWGTLLAPGVEVSGLGPIGVSISGVSSRTEGSSPVQYATGTMTGFFAASATNWSFETESYKVILHCTSSKADGWTVG